MSQAEMTFRLIQEVSSQSTRSRHSQRTFHSPTADKTAITFLTNHTQSVALESHLTVALNERWVASNSLHVMPLAAESWACIVTRSVTSRTIMLPSDRQTATMEPRAGFHFRSCTEVPAGTAGCREAKGSLGCLPCSGKLKRGKHGKMK